MITGKTKICITIGDPIVKSLSPVMHNAGLKALGLEGEYIFLAAKIGLDNLQKVTSAIRVLDVKAVSVTMPNKIAVMDYLDEVDEKALKIGAVNTIINSNGRLKGFNTDWIGAIESLKQKTEIKGKRVGLLGAGGAARAIAFGIKREEGRLKIFNRTFENAKELADEFNGEAFTLFDSNLSDCEIIINSTSVGMDSKLSPINKDVFKKGQIVFDIVYHPYNTQFLKDAKSKGAEIIHGTDMLVFQGAAQLKMYTGKKAPVEKMREAVLKSI